MIPQPYTDLKQYQNKKRVRAVSNNNFSQQNRQNQLGKQLPDIEKCQSQHQKLLPNQPEIKVSISKQVNQSFDKFMQEIEYKKQKSQKQINRNQNLINVSCNQINANTQQIQPPKMFGTSHRARTSKQKPQNKSLTQSSAKEVKFDNYKLFKKQQIALQDQIPETKSVTNYLSTNINPESNQLHSNKNDVKDPLQQIEYYNQMFRKEKAKIDEVINNGNQQLSKTEQKWYNTTSQKQTESYYSSDLKQDESNTNQSDLINPTLPNFKFKEGLIGGIEEYQKMTKEQLIEKLIVSEHIMKKLYKQNRELQAQVGQQCNDQQTKN